MRKTVYSICGVAFVLFVLSCNPNASNSLGKRVVHLRDLPKSDVFPVTILRHPASKNESTHGYSVYTLPSAGEHNVRTLELLVHFDETMAILKEKGVFLVVSYSGEGTHHISSLFTPGSSTARRAPIEKKDRSNAARIAARMRQDDSPTKEYSDISVFKVDAESMAKKSLTTRTFVFSPTHHIDPTYASTKRRQAKLYNRVDIEVGGKKRQFAFWVQDEIFKDEDEEEAKKVIEDFGKHLRTSLYEMLYSINSKMHVWDEHLFGNAAAPADSVIHIAFGELGEKNVQGFVNPCTSFKSTQKIKICPQAVENDMTPIVYVAAQLLKNIIDHPSTKKNKEKADIIKRVGESKLYSVLVHEIQHVFTHYSKMVKGKTHVLQQPDTWLQELISVATTYLLWPKIAEILKAHRGVYLDYFLRRFQTNLITSSPLAFAKDTQSGGEAYLLSFLFASYVVQNYGVKAIENLIASDDQGGEAIFNAVKNTSAYGRIDHPPKDSQDIMLAFYTSLFTSDTIQSTEATHQYKMFTFHDSNQSEWIKAKGVKIAQIQDRDLTPFDILSMNIYASPQYIPDKNFPLSFPKSAQIDLNYTWARQHGPYIFLPSGVSDGVNKIVKDNLKRRAGQYSIIYLGGRIRSKKDFIYMSDGSETNLGFRSSATSTDKLELFVRLPRGTKANIVVVKF